MPDDISNKLVISAALAGAFTRKEQNPAVLLTLFHFLHSFFLAHQ